MPISSILLIFFTHGLPILFFTYMIVDILMRNTKKLDYLLVSAIMATYLLLFVEEMLRNMASISYSPFLASAVFSSLGILNVCFGLHFILSISKWTKKIPTYVTLIICYAPVIFILFNIISGAHLFSTQTFESVGPWIYPIYNANYYTTLIVSLVANLIIIIPLYFAYRQTTQVLEKNAYKVLLRGLSYLIVLCLLLGVLPLQSILPPFPYIYGGIYFCYVLKLMMNRYHFFEQHDKRYEKLFAMNPYGIVILDRDLNVLEVNPVAKKYLTKFKFDIRQVLDQLTQEQICLLRDEEKVDDLEITVTFPPYTFYFLVSVDELTMNFEKARFIIIRDITQSKRQQQKISDLAYKDTLTGIANRRYIFEQIEEVKHQVIEADELLAIYLVDMNNLKMLNDQYGHYVGDQAIQALASLLNEMVGDYGLVARIGGDEFMLYINESQSNYKADTFIPMIQEAFADATMDYGHLPIGISVGYSHYPLDHLSTDVLVSIADKKMYEMKKHKKVHYR